MFSDLTPEAFLDCLSKGKGRTFLALQNGNPDLYTDALLRGCVENLQFDRQFEENRAEYMLRLLEVANMKERAFEAILGTLPDSEEGWDRDWMIDLLGEFAKKGDRVARETLANLAVEGEERAQNRLAGTDDEGLQWVERNVLASLRPEDYWRLGMWLPHEESDDTTPTQRRLRDICDRGFEDQKAVSKTRLKPKPSAKGFLRSLDDPMLPFVSPISFERVATKREWLLAARRLLRETDPRALRRLTQAFKRDQFPLPACKLFRLATHPTRGWAVMAMLGTLDTPAVRRFTLGMLRRRPLPWNAIGALTKSLRKGDEPLILRALQSTEGDSNVDRHASIIDVLNFFDRMPNGKWQDHAEWIYEHSPCSMCRTTAVRWLVEHGNIPAYIREEAPHDAESSIREFFQRAVQQNPGPKGPGPV